MASNPATTAGIRRGAQRDLAKVRDNLKIEVSPALVEHARQRADNAQNRIADRITAFAGSMLFVYIHIIWFAAWIILCVEDYPFGLLTMIVSLESIFLSTFVLISQNRSDEKNDALADDRWRTVQHEAEQTDELMRTVAKILEQTTALTGAANNSRSTPIQGAG